MHAFDRTRNFCFDNGIIICARLVKKRRARSKRSFRVHYWRARVSEARVRYLAHARVNIEIGARMLYNSTLIQDKS